MLGVCGERGDCTQLFVTGVYQEFFSKLSKVVFLEAHKQLLLKLSRVSRGHWNLARDAFYMVKLQSLAPGSVARVFVLFPDPWPKARHHKRRFIRPDNLDLIGRVLVPGGELRIGTDHADYGNWILRHMHQRLDFEWLAESAADWRTRPCDWPQTRYEAKAVREGRTSIYLRYRRIGDVNRP